LSDESERIIVRKDKLARCNWCGSPESNKWIPSEEGRLFCTEECMTAATMDRKKQSAAFNLFCGVILIFGPIIFLMGFGFSLAAISGMFELFFYGICLICVGVGIYLSANEGEKYIDRKDRYTGVPPLVCEYCNHPNPPRVTRCLNCDATLSQAPFADDALPPWIHKHAKISGVKCPYCSAIYSYLPAMISDDYDVHCQNCTRQFHLPGRYHSTDIPNPTRFDY